MAELQGSKLVEVMCDIARESHEGQKHFFGEGSYFDMHIEPVANIIRRMGYGAMYIATGYGHDLLEDTKTTAQDLKAERIPYDVIRAIELMTKEDGLNHEQMAAYRRGLLESPYSTVGKWADSGYNASWTILNSPDLPNRYFAAWLLEYQENISFLLPHLPPIDRD